MNSTNVNTSFGPIVNNIDGSSVQDIDILGDPIFWVIQGLAILVAILAIAGNVTSVVVILGNHTLRENPACLFLVSLSIADVLGGVQLCTSFARNIVTSLYIHNVLCRLQFFLIAANTAGNVLSFVLCTIDRFLYVEMAMRYHTLMTPTRAQAAIIVIWLATVIQAGTFVVWETDPNKILICEAENEQLIRPVAIYFTPIQKVFLTLFILSPIYVKIYRTTKRLIDTDPHFTNFPPEAQAQQKKKIAQRKLTLTIGLTFLLYILLNFPVTVYFLIASKLYTKPWPFGVLLGYKLLSLVFWLQFFLNPIVYAFKDPMLRVAYRKIFCKNSVNHAVNPGIELQQF